jgi:hypothetical protein
VAGFTLQVRFAFIAPTARSTHAHASAALAASFKLESR